MPTFISIPTVWNDVSRPVNYYVNVNNITGFGPTPEMEDGIHSEAKTGIHLTNAPPIYTSLSCLELLSLINPTVN